MKNYVLQPYETWLATISLMDSVWLAFSVCFYSDSESEILFFIHYYNWFTNQHLYPQITLFLLWIHPLFNSSIVKLAPTSMPIITKYYCSVIRWNKQPSVCTLVWLTLMKVLISLFMRSLSSAFFSLHLWPEYLWKIWMMETIPFSSSDMLSSAVCSRQFHDVQFQIIFFYLHLDKRCEVLSFLPSLETLVLQGE